MPKYLAEHWKEYLENDYEIIPIRPGHKFPDNDDWRKGEITSDRIEAWILGNRAHYGVGIRTDRTPGIDVDCWDEDFCRRFRDWLQDNIGFAPARVGQKPKFLMMYRTETPFRKLFSKEWIDNQGRKAQMEILGSGQQFVSHHIHPDTKKPYYWLDSETPLNTPWEQLTILTPQLAEKAVAEFDKRAEAAGWTPKKTAQRQATTVSDDPFGDIDNEPVPDLTDEMLETMVETIVNTEDRDRDYWFGFISAIHHQTEGSDFGREIALSWSEKHSSHDPALFDKAWKSIKDGSADNRKLRTARSIIKEYNEIKATEQTARIADIVDRMEKAQKPEDLKKIAAECRSIDADPSEKALAIGALRDAFKRLTGKLLPVADARQMIRYNRSGSAAMPDWAAPWIYLSNAERFFNRESKEMVSPRSFSLMFAAKVMKGDDAARYAVADLKIPVRYMTSYAPTEGEEFELDGHLYVNSFSPASVPEVPEQITSRDRENVERIKQHFTHLIADRTEIEIFQKWLAYIVQTRARPNWAVVLQGVDGDGKSFFAQLMAEVLGKQNVSVLHADLILRSAHNDWAHGHMLTCIEEIRVSGQNRHETLDRFKPLITNPEIQINPKGINHYNCPNTQAYLLTTNYGNALPITENDRRYFIIMSQWQHADAIERFNAENPDYFERLYRAIEQSPGALRKWFLDIDLADFKAKGRAPHSAGRQQMIDDTRSDEASFLNDLIRQGRNDMITKDLIISSAFSEACMEEFGHPVAGYTLQNTFRSAGYSRLGRIRLDGSQQAQIWVKNPSEWPTTENDRRISIKRYLDDQEL